MGVVSSVLRLILLVVLGWFLITPPLLPAGAGLVFGFPTAAVYLFTVWLGLIGIARWILGAGRRAGG
jgi:hypothetical protein